MEGKLIKQEDGYYALYNAEGIFISDVNGGSVTNRLSLKNCQEIENGYDLDKLALDYYKLVFGNTKSYKDGFQKALEILGDKKFSEKDVISMIEKSRETGLTAEYLMLTKQQTEWDVVVEMDIDNPCPKCGEKDNVHGNYDYSNITRPLINTLCNECGTYFSPIPKLDADGCIVLKRK